jgi:serine/threonine protein kinase
VGTVVANRYRVVRVLGTGSNGAVCEVSDQVTGRYAALKLLVGEDAERAARLEREGKALSMLAHPHIVELVDVGTLEDGSPYVATELVRGVSLQDEIDTTVIAPVRALAIVRQLLEALHHAHGAGLIHRDVKPDNIMLTAAGGWEGGGDDFVKLLDFGVAKLVDPDAIGEAKLTRAGLEVYGTPAYMSPEAAIGEPVDVRSDVYSVGIVLFELLTGRVPFHHDDPVTLMRMHVTQPAPLLGDVAPDRMFPPELEQLVAQAIDKVPDRRFGSAMAMHALVQIVARSLEADGEPTKVAATPAAPAPVVIAPPAANLPTTYPQASRMPLPAAPPRTPPSRFERAQRWWVAQRASAMRHPRRTAAFGTAAIALIVVLIVAIGRDGSPSPASPSADAKEASIPASVIPKPATAPTTDRAVRTQADTELGKKHYRRALAAYERVLAGDKAAARDGKLRAAIAQIATHGDAVPAVIALEVLATRLDPPDHKTIAELASNSRVPDVRQRAFTIAERDGFTASVDRFASWSLDTQQGSCDDRREAVAKLRDLGDKRAVDVIQKAGKLPCLAKDAAAAIAQLQPPPAP